MRCYTVIRSAHLERARQFAPASIVFADRRYDFDDRLTAGLDLQQRGTLGLFRTLLREPVAVVEINEPLQLDAVPRSLAALAAVTLRRLARRPVSLVAYGIENRDPFTGPAGRLRTRLKRRGQRWAAGLITRRLDRLALGTPGAAELYARRLGRPVDGSATALIPALPAPCGCPDDTRDRDLVLFVGALHRRKGVPELLAAWPGVRRVRPSARLEVIGTGDLQPLVEAAAEADRQLTLTLDPPRAVIHQALRRAAVVVLLSQPSPTWREQVGLPILEALGHGCAVLTTDQTGLAGWLAEHRHRVLDPEDGPDVIAAAIVEALAAARATSAVLADLPALDGRHAADEWLMADVTGSAPR